MTEPETIGLVALVGTLSTLAGVLVGGALNERWAAQRERRAEKRAEVDRLRARQLDTIDQTRRATHAALTAALGRAAGDPNVGEVQIGGDVYPRVDLRLIADLNVARRFFGVLGDLTRSDRGGVTSRDADDVASLQTTGKGSEAPAT